MKSINDLVKAQLALFLRDCMTQAANEMAQHALKTSVNAQRLRERVEASRPAPRR